jgi:hypothetical protein
MTSCRAQAFHNGQEINLILSPLSLPLQVIPTDTVVVFDRIRKTQQTEESVEGYEYQHQ